MTEMHAAAGRLGRIPTATTGSKIVGVKGRGPNLTVRAAAARLVAVLLLMSIVAACEEIGRPKIPADVRTPSIAAVVQGMDQKPASMRRYRLAGGGEIEVDLKNAELGPDGAPKPGDLLLLGSRPDNRSWLIPVPLDPYGSDPGCFYATWTGRDANDASVDVVINGVPFALRLPKAPGFSSNDSRRGVYAVWRSYFCLDGQGRLVSYK